MRPLSWFLSAAAALLFAACGNVGPKIIPPFSSAAMGTAGGNIQAGSVVLVLPSGALMQPTIVSILPQPNPLPVDPQAPPVTFMPGFMCIGPIGTNLGVPAHVQFCYDPLTIPFGSTENDVVLLEWDANANFLRIINAAVKNTTLHCFDHITYGQLGHIGVGALSGLKRNFVFAANPGVPLKAAARAAAVPGFGLVLASSTGVDVPEPLPGTFGAKGYVASRDAAHVLWRAGDPLRLSIGGPALHSSSVATEAVSAVLPSGTSFFTFDPLYGFLTASRVFHARSRFDDDFLGDTLAEVGVTGTPGPSDLYFAASASGDLIDVRVSPDEKMVLLRYREFGEGTFDSLFVIDAVTGNEIGTFLPGVNNTSDVTPRWIPDSSGLYFVDSFPSKTVSAYQPDGTSLGVIYTLPSKSGEYIQDFVVAPSVDWGIQPTTPCAYIKGTNAVRAMSVVPGSIAIGNSSFFVRDLLGGGALASLDLGVPVGVNELIYHPNATKVIADLVDQSGNFGLRPALNGGSTESVHIFDATTALQLHVFVSTLENFDLARDSGELVVWFPSGGVDPNFPLPGLYDLAQNGDTLSTIDTQGITPTGPPRFLRSWRRTPGEFASNIR